MGLSSSQPIPSSSYSATAPPLGSGPKMDDWAASQQLIEEEAQSARGRRFRSPLASYSLPDLQAFTEGDTTSSAWPVSPLKKFALRSANASRNVLVPDSQSDPASTHAPSMSQTTSSQAVPTSSAPKRNKKGKKKARAETETASALPEGEDPSSTSSQPARKRKLSETNVPDSSTNAIPTELATASPKNDAETPSSAKRQKRVSKGMRAWKRRSMEALRDNATAETALGENGDDASHQLQIEEEQNTPKSTKKKPRRPGKQAATNDGDVLETPSTTQNELPDASGDVVDEPVEMLAMEDGPILPGSLLEDLKAKKTKSRSKHAEDTNGGTPTRPENSSQKNTPASNSKVTAALQLSSTKESSKKRRKKRQSNEVAPDEQEQGLEQDATKEIADTPEPTSGQQEDPAPPATQDTFPDQQQSQANSQESDTFVTPNKISDSDERQSKRSQKKKKKSEKALDTYDWKAPPVRNADEPPEETPSYEGLEEAEVQGEEEKKKPASTPRATKKKSKKKAGENKTPRKGRKSLPPAEQYRRAVDDDGLTQAERALERHRQLHHPPDLRKSGDFTDDEQEIVRRAIRDYQERKGLTTHELVSIIQYTHDYKDTANTWATFGGTQVEEQDKQESLEFWNEMKETSLKRDFATIKGHIRSQYHTFRTGRWTEEETEQLRSLHALNPGQWKLISHIMGTRSLNDVFNRWRDYEQFGENRVINRWSEEEENNLVRVLSVVCQRDEDQRAELGRPPLAEYTNSDINWAQVCVELGNTRSRIQCQQKWTRMKARTPPATIEIEIKARNPDVVYDESKKRRKSGVKQGSANGEDKKRRQSRKQREPPTLSADQMLWGDKFDLIAVITEQVVRGSLEEESQIEWDDVFNGLERKWPVSALRTVFTELLETIKPRDNLKDAVVAVLDYMTENHADEINDRYEVPEVAESADEETPLPNSSRKRRQGEGKSSSGKRKKTEARQIRSKALITESDDAESEHEA